MRVPLLPSQLRQLSYFILLLLIVACSSTTKIIEKNNQPGWITNPHKKYNENLYITSVGTGDTKKSAEDNAYANIAKIFQADIKAEERLSQKYKETGIGKETQISSEEEVKNIYNIKSSQTLKNIKIAETYFNPEEGNYYVLAYLDRMETASIYEQEIELNNEKIAGYYDRYTKNGNKLNKLKYLNNAIQFAATNNILNTQLRIISPANQGVSLPISYEELKSERQKFASSISVIIHSTGEYQNYLEKYLKEAFARFGFSILEHNNEDLSDLLVQSNLEIQPIDLKRKQKFVRWQISITILNRISGSEDITYTKKGRQGHINLEEAKNRALTDVKNIISNDFYNFLLTKLMK
jgi:hypothetical protein